MRRTLVGSLLVAGLLVTGCSDGDGSSAPSAGDADLGRTTGDGAGDDRTRDEETPADDPAGSDGAGGDGTADAEPGVGNDEPADPATLAMREPRLAERLCTVDPRLSIPEVPADADPEELREVIEAVRDPVAELIVSLPEVEGGAELAALLDAVVVGWTDAVRAYDAGEPDTARRLMAEAATRLQDVRSQADVVLAACGRS